MKIDHDKLYIYIDVYIQNMKDCLPVASHHIRGNYSQLPKYLHYTLPAEFDILNAVKIGLVADRKRAIFRRNPARREFTFDAAWPVMSVIPAVSLNSENSNIRSNVLQ